MAGKDIVIMSQRELKRLQVIGKAAEGVIKQAEAGEILSLSDRQIRRIIKRVREEGNHGIAHKSRGRPSNRGIPEKVKQKAVNLYREKYKGFGPTLAAEKLSETKGIDISDETLRKWLMESGDWEKTRKGVQHRQWRERKHYFGEMIQMDGSHHDWFEGRGPKCVLMGYIDDATGIVFGRFYGYEGTIPAFDSFKQYIKKYGIPVKVYLDRHTTYKSPRKDAYEWEPEALSQFERAMKEFGVELIHAGSPQAKGRVERLFRTLQDRLVKEMRLSGISSIEQANEFLKEYLPAYNRKFAIRPKEQGNLHRGVPKGMRLDDILCIKTERILRNDFTVAHNGKLYQIKDNIKAGKVIVIERINGSMTIMHKDTSLKFKEITDRPQKQQKQRSVRRPKNKYKPPVNHPWRRIGIKVHGGQKMAIGK